MTHSADPNRGAIPPPSIERTSVLLKRVLANLPGNDVSVGYLLLQFRRRSFGGILVLLAILGLLPGISLVAGLIILIPAGQMAIGYRAPMLPRFIRRRRIDVAALRKLGERTMPWLERLERHIRPRWLPLSHAAMPAIVGVVSVGLGLVIILPLPFSNFPPAVALTCLSLGLLERDGVLIAAGLGLSAAALAIGGSMAYLAVETLTLLQDKVSD